MDDNKLFPAYGDYIQGITTRHPIDGEDAVIIPDEVSSRASIYTDGDVFGPVSMRRPPPPTVHDTRRSPSPAVLDLRLPHQFPDLINLIPPETVHPAPAAPEDEDCTSAEPSRRKLFASPQQPAPLATRTPTSSQQLLHNLKKAAKTKSTPRRRGRPRQATHSSLLRGASVADNETCQSARSSFSVSSIDSPAQADKPELQRTPRLQQPSTDSPVVSKSRLPRLGGLTPTRSSDTAIIRPGELLSQARFAELPLPGRQQMNAQIARMWSFASAHADSAVKHEAISRLAVVSAKIYRLMQDQEKAKSAQSQPGTQTAEQPQRQGPEVVNPQVAHDSDEITPELRAHVDKSFGRLVVALRMCQLPPPHNPTAVQVVNTYPAFRQSLSAAGLQYLDTLIADMKTRENPLRIGLQVLANPSVQQPSTTFQHQVKAPPQQAGYQHQQASQNTSYQHPPVPQQQQQPVPQSQCRYSALLKAQREVPVAAVSDGVRFFVNENVPKYFEAMDILKQPPKTCNPAVRQKAHIFMDRFDKALPPEGHNYLMEIVRRVEVDKSAGLDE